MDNNTTTNVLQQQYVSDIESVDYSADCSLDWDKFSFESEINTRANIYKQNLQALKLMAESPALVKVEEEDITELQKNKEVYGKLLQNNTNIHTKYNSLIKEYKNIKQNLENLTAHNKSIENTIKGLEKEESNSRKEYLQLKNALQRGYEMYSTHFNINVTTKSLTDNTYEATLRFIEKVDAGSIKFTVDRLSRKVIDFCTNGVLLPEEDEDIRNKFGNLDNLPGLLCALREGVLRKQNIVS